jgi:hypothetical protein
MRAMALRKGGLGATGARGDAVQLYLREIARIPLLTGRQEQEIGQRVERGQTALRRMLPRIPTAVPALLDVMDQLRRGELAPHAVIAADAAGVIGAETVKRALDRCSRIRAPERLRFGLVEERAWSLREVGRRLLLTRERIRQIEKEALRKLRAPSGGWE